jgi:hypothetical protein
MKKSRIIHNLKVSLFYRKRIYRLIEIPGNNTLDDLHEVIFKAFERCDEHLYTFYLTRKKVKNVRLSNMNSYLQYSHPISFDQKFRIFDVEENEFNAAKTKIDSMMLEPGTVFYYLFDFGDEWWHEITVLKIGQEKEGVKYPRIVKAAGDAPSQYPEIEENE